MEFLSDMAEQESMKYIKIASEIALNSTCLRSKCGSIIVKDNRIIGKGFNSPPGDLESQRKCLISKEDFHSKVADKTCCVHAEQRAIIDALGNNFDDVKGSRLYFIRLDNENNIMEAGKPYCTHCSKLALDVGIAEFVLWHKNGICVYDTSEYNLISYNYSD